MSMLAKGRGGWSVSQKRIVILLMFVTTGIPVLNFPSMIGQKPLEVSIIFQVPLFTESLWPGDVKFFLSASSAMFCWPWIAHLPLNQRFALIEKLVFTLCCGWGGGGGGVVSLPGSSTEPHHLAPNCLIT